MKLLFPILIAVAFIAYTFAEFAVPSPPSVTNSYTQPVFPESLIPESLKEQYKAEAEAEARKAIDTEKRPKVYFQRRKSLTNEWETVLMLEPYELQKFYRVIVK